MKFLEWLRSLFARKEKPVQEKPAFTEREQPAKPEQFNPFRLWRADGLTIQDVIIYKFRRGLTDSERAQAMEAGYVLDAPKPQGPEVDKTGLNLDLPGRRENNHEAGYKYTYTFTVPQGTKMLELGLRALGATVFRGGTESLSGGLERRWEVSEGRAIYRRQESNPRPGAHTWIVSTDQACYVGVDVHLS